MYQKISAAVCVLAILNGCAGTVNSTDKKSFSEEEKALYTAGQVLARQVAPFQLSDSELELVKLGLTDGVQGKEPLFDFATYSKKSQEIAFARRDAHGAWLEKRAEAFIKAEAAREGAVTTKVGAIYQPLREGTGPSPVHSNTISVHYVSTLLDGREMESTYKNGAPDQLKLGEFMNCLKEGVQLMKAGGKARIICPPETALGKEGDGVIPPNATLVFTIELLEVK